MADNKFLVEVNIREIVPGTEKQVYNEQTRRHDKVVTKPDLNQVLHLIQRAPELEGAVVSIQRHLDVVLGLETEANDA